MGWRSTARAIADVAEQLGYFPASIQHCYYNQHDQPNNQMFLHSLLPFVRLMLARSIGLSNVRKFLTFAFCSPIVRGGRGNGKRVAFGSIAIFGSHELDAAR